jgi:hypothetical protein
VTRSRKRRSYTAFLPRRLHGNSGTLHGTVFTKMLVRNKTTACRSPSVCTPEVLGRSWVKISARRPKILTEVFRGFLQSLQVNAFGSLFYDAFSVSTLYSVDDRMTNDDGQGKRLHALSGIRTQESQCSSD